MLKNKKVKMADENFVIFHYGEIALKSGNRLFFEKKLVENIKNVLKGCGLEKIEMQRGKIIATLLPDARLDAIVERSKYIFGLEHAFFAVAVKSEFETISKAVVELMKNTEGTFKIKCVRSNKRFPMTSIEVNAKLGEQVINELGRKVDIKNPQVRCVVEISERETYIGCRAWRGPGGLPCGTQKKILMLLSGGIDSPIAGLRLLRRGATVSGVHFHSYPQTSRASLDKVKDLASIIGIAQKGMNVYLVPFLDVQKEVVKNAPAKLRVILYRRSMYRIAELIARRQGFLALGTGESLGQVASQTLENISVIDKAIDLPVLRPLIGFDKVETMDEARKFGTYDISIREHEDCCSLFLPEHPETGARLNDVITAEASMVGLFKIEEQCLEQMEKVFVRPMS